MSMPNKPSPGFAPPREGVLSASGTAGTAYTPVRRIRGISRAGPTVPPARRPCPPQSVAPSARGDRRHGAAADAHHRGDSPLAVRSQVQEPLDFGDNFRGDHRSTSIIANVAAVTIAAQQKKPAAGANSSDGLLWLPGEQALRIPSARPQP